MNIKGFIFDMDGVIVDNHHFHVNAWEKFITAHNRTLTADEFSLHFNGRTTRQALKYLFPEITAQDLDRFKEEKESLYRQLIRPHLKETAGLSGFLKSLKEQGYLTAVATAAYPPNVAFTLDTLGIREYFDVILDETAVTHGKPHPEIYTKTINALDLQPEECVVFEDSFSGIQAGKEAGAEVIGVIGTETKEQLANVVRNSILNFVNFDFSLINGKLNR
jgi:beta-phosphoglucomutase